MAFLRVFYKIIFNNILRRHYFSFSFYLISQEGLIPFLKRLSAFIQRDFESDNLIKVLNTIINADSLDAEFIPVNDLVYLNCENLVISHVWNRSGAPYLAQQICQELSKMGKTKILSIHKPENKTFLLPDDVELIFDETRSLLSYNFSKVDSVIVNSMALPDKSIIQLLKLKEKYSFNLIFYIHENVLCINESTQKTLKKYYDKYPKISFVTTGNDCRKKWQKYLGLPVNYLPNPLDASFWLPPKNPSFTLLKIHLSGPATDNRKGHLKALRLFWLYSKVPLRIRRRDFILEFIGFEEVNYYSKFIKKRANLLLRRHISFYPNLDLSSYRDRLANLNVVWCQSTYETLPLFVSKSMLMKHIVLRNRCGGFIEQLIPKKNGFEISRSLLRNLFTLIKLGRLSEIELIKMAECSRQIAIDLHRFSYKELLD